MLAYVDVSIVILEEKLLDANDAEQKMMRSASNQSSHVIPDAIRVAMRAIDGSAAAPSATYVETMLPDEHESVFVEVCNLFANFANFPFFGLTTRTVSPRCNVL